MKLLIVYHAGNSEDAKNIFREYTRQGVELTVIVPAGNNPLTEEKTYRCVQVAFNGWFEFLPLLRAIKKANPSVIQVFDEYTSLYLSQVIFCRNIVCRRVPVFAYAFQNIAFKSPGIGAGFSWRFLKRAAYKACYPLVFWYHNKYVTGVIGSNDEALLNVKKINQKIPTKLIFWGVDVGKFFPKNRDISREKLGIPKNIKLAGYVGRMLEEKGLNDLIYAVEKMKDVNLLLVGDGNHKAKLIDKINFLGIEKRVFFYNGVRQADLVDFYNALDVFVLPSRTTPGWKEQYGRVLVEAMACGLPVVGSSSGAIPEVLKDYPRGFIFSEGDVRDLVAKITLAQESTFPVNFNSEEFLYKFSVRNFAKEHISFYGKFL